MILWWTSYWDLLIESLATGLILVLRLCSPSGIVVVLKLIAAELRHLTRHLSCMRKRNWSLLGTSLFWSMNGVRRNVIR